MSLLIKPTLACNLSCKYCYQNRLFRNPDYDIDWIIGELERLLSSRDPDVGHLVTLHGGEPLILPPEHIRRIFETIRKYGYPISIQTNGTLINDEIIELFKEFKVSVGVSIDGPGELNVLRAPPNLTKRVLDNIERLVSEGVSVGLITVVHRYNAGTEERFSRLLEFIDHMSGDLGVTGRLNPLGYPAPKDLFLDPDRLAQVYRRLAEFMFDRGYRWSPFVDLWNAITGKGEVVCVFRPCDPFNTAAALVLRGDKIITNCQRHLPLVRDSRRMQIREEALSKTPYEYGGCRGCKYFPICYGGCSANGLNGDWRNRDLNCPAWRAVLDYYDSVLRFMGVTPAYIQKFREQQSSRPNKSFEHVDGGIRHLDSNVQHSDGIEHLDGGMRHLDSGGRRCG